jgi:uncharacterized protein
MNNDVPRMELNLGSIDSSETFTFHERFPVPIEDEGTADCDAGVSGSVTKTGSRLLLSAGIDCRISVSCGRCLRRFDLPVRTRFDLVFHRGERAHVPEGMDEDDFIQLTDATAYRYDIYPRVKEAIILEMPMKFLCSEDCRGLCAKCGANLNEGDCGCAKEDGDPRWDALRNIFDETADE